MEHDCWRGSKNISKPGRIAIVGYSHHRQTQYKDHKGFTRQILNAVVDGSQKGDSFYANVANYFGATDHPEFWENTLFFNFIPECIGTTDKKYGIAGKTLHDAGRQRFSRIIQAEKPSKIFIFSTKAWRECPPTIEEARGESCASLGADLGTASWGRYELDDRKVIAIGMRHPQFANKSQMMKAVEAASQLT